MIEQRNDRLDPTAPYGFALAKRTGWRPIISSAEVADALVGTLTSYERTLTWCVLTLLSTRTAPPPGRSLPTASMPDRSAAALPGSLRLTTRETEVLGLVALGLTNAQIAARLFLSRRTIDQHLSSIYNRLGVSSRTAATRFALLNELVLTEG